MMPPPPLPRMVRLIDNIIICSLDEKKYQKLGQKDLDGNFPIIFRF